MASSFSSEKLTAIEFRGSGHATKFLCSVPLNFVFAHSLCRIAFLKFMLPEGNMIGDNGIVFLAKALKRNQTLTSLSLGDNFITDDGAECLVEALNYNSTLQVCFLRNSEHYNGQAE